MIALSHRSHSRKQPRSFSADSRDSEECPDIVGALQTGRGTAIEGTLLPQLNMDDLAQLLRNNKKAEAHILHCWNDWSAADEQAYLGIAEDTWHDPSGGGHL